MMSIFPAMQSTDCLFGFPFPAFEGRFTPWNCQEPSFLTPQHEEPLLCQEPPHEPVISNSGSEKNNPKPVTSNSGSEKSDPNREKNNSGSDDSNRIVLVMEERKRRRMISNRESARRSRMRKQKHLENLRTKANRLKIGNREIMNRLRFFVQHLQVVRRDNERLRAEAVVLQQRLWDIRQVLLVRQLQQQLSLPAWPCDNIITSFNEQNQPPLIT